MTTLPAGMMKKKNNGALSSASPICKHRSSALDSLSICACGRCVHGFTLIEIMVVIAIMAGMMGLAIGLFGNSAQAQLKKESGHLAGAIRFLYNEAASKNLYYRIVFDLDEQKYWIESSTEPILLKTPEQEEAERKKKEQESPVGDDQAEALPPAFTQETELVVKRVSFKKGIKIRDIYLDRIGESLTTGQVTLYFFPQGMTESIIIHLSDDDERLNYSIIVNPITGHAKIESDYVEPIK